MKFYEKTSFDAKVFERQSFSAFLITEVELGKNDNDYIWKLNDHIFWIFYEKSQLSKM